MHLSPSIKYNYLFYLYIYKISFFKYNFAYIKKKIYVSNKLTGGRGLGELLRIMKRAKSDNQLTPFLPHKKLTNAVAHCSDPTSLVNHVFVRPIKYVLVQMLYSKSRITFIYSDPTDRQTS